MCKYKTLGDTGLFSLHIERPSYVGQTHQKCANHMNCHKYDIAHFPDTLTNVSDHLNSPGHSVQYC